MAWLKKHAAATDEYDITGLIPVPIDAGRLSVERVGGITVLSAENMKLGEIAGSNIDLLPNGTLPVGLRTRRSKWHNISMSNGRIVRIALTAGGRLVAYYAQTGDVLHFTLLFPTPGAMPTTMPGVKL
ncbi:hypothetical protein [Gulosibacter faecalis]|uniref:Uncharacterized protein n=1 Tax=Gulosibacter faecalis TaxID=272240 RepID=A0ABW5UV54_9MICO|nr:hypothetical protein [Gulosibacter faecalis]